MILVGQELQSIIVVVMGWFYNVFFNVILENNFLDNIFYYYLFDLSISITSLISTPIASPLIIL